MTKEEMERLSLAGMAEEFKLLQAALKESKDQSTEIQKQFDLLRKIVLPSKMEAEGYDTVNISGVGRISIRAEIYASIIIEMKEEAYKWLEENGHGALIKETINASTLKAFMKEQLANGEDIPEAIFNCVPYDMATLTKS